MDYEDDYIASPYVGWRISSPVNFINDNHLDADAVTGYRAIVVPNGDEVADIGNPQDYLASLDQATSDLITNQTSVLQMQTMLVPVRRNANWFNTSSPQGHQNMKTSFWNHLTDEAGMPDVFVTRKGTANTVQAGFYTSDDNEIMVIPMVINPMWGLPRDAEALPNITYNEVVNVQAGDIRIHIKGTAAIAPTTTVPLQVRIGFADLDTPDHVFYVAANSINSDGEFVITIPTTFSQFAMVMLSKK
jgi:hypothetical protein